jgi:hypothetical protein
MGLQLSGLLGGLIVQTDWTLTHEKTKTPVGAKLARESGVSVNTHVD